MDKKEIEKLIDEIPGMTFDRTDVKRKFGIPFNTEDKIWELKMKKSKILAELTAPWGINEFPGDIEQVFKFKEVWAKQIEPIQKEIKKLKKL